MESERQLEYTWNDFSQHLKDTGAGITMPVAVLGENCYARPIFLRISNENYSVKSTNLPNRNKPSFSITKHNNNSTFSTTTFQKKPERPKSSLHGLKRFVKETYFSPDFRMLNKSHDYSSPNSIKSFDRKKRGSTNNAYIIQTKYSLIKQKGRAPLLKSNVNMSFDSSLNSLVRFPFIKKSVQVEQKQPEIAETKVKDVNKFAQIKTLLIKKIKDIENEESVYHLSEKRAS